MSNAVEQAETFITDLYSITSSISYEQAYKCIASCIVQLNKMYVLTGNVELQIAIGDLEELIDNMVMPVWNYLDDDDEFGSLAS